MSIQKFNRQQHGTDSIPIHIFFTSFLSLGSLLPSWTLQPEVPQKRRSARVQAWMLAASLTFLRSPHPPQCHEVGKLIEKHYISPNPNYSLSIFSKKTCLKWYAQMKLTFRWVRPMHEIASRRWSNALKVTLGIDINFNETCFTVLV